MCCPHEVLGGPVEDVFIGYNERDNILRGIAGSSFEI